MHVRRAVWAAFFLLGFAGAGACIGQDWKDSISAEEIIRREMQQDKVRRDALIRYGSERTYQMDYRGPIGERHARMRVRMDYTAPESKQFTVLSESGSTVFCHQIISRLIEGEREGALEANRTRSMLSPENYRLKLEGEESFAGERAWIVGVEPKNDSKFNYKGRVWISQTDFAVMRIVGTPAKNPSLFMGSSTFDYTYSRNGEFWLPTRNETVSHLRIGGEITLSVDYGRYDVVAGEATGVISASNRGGDGHSALHSVSMPLSQ